MASEVTTSRSRPMPIPAPAASSGTNAPSAAKVVPQQKNFADELAAAGRNSTAEKAPDRAAAPTKQRAESGPRSHDAGKSGQQQTDASAATKSTSAPTEQRADQGKDAHQAESAPTKDQSTSSGKDANAAEDSQDRLAERRAARKTLQPLHKAAQTQKQAIATAPVVALLTGRLEHLDPSAIPALVSQNEFLAQALGQGDVTSYLDSPMAIADLIEALDLPPSILEQARELGLDVAQAMSPQDILRALGLDPQRIGAELKLLKENLSSEGLAPYMQRAAAAAAAAGPASQGIRNQVLEDERFDKRPEWAKGPKTPTVGGGPVTPLSVQNPSLNSSPSTPSLSSIRSATPSDSTSMPRSSAGMSSMSGGADLGTVAAGSSQQDLIASLLSPSQPNSIVDPSLVAQTTTPQVQQVASDPFVAMNAHMRGANVLNISGQALGQNSGSATIAGQDATILPRDAAAGGSLLEEALLRAHLSQTALPQNPSSALAARPNAMLGEARELGLEQAGMDLTEGSDLRQNDLMKLLQPSGSSASYAARGNASGILDALKAAPQKAVSIEDMHLATPMSLTTVMSAEARGDGERGSSGGDPRDFGEGARDFHSMLDSRDLSGQGANLTTGQSPGTSAFVLESTRSEALGELSTQQRADLVKKIFDNATMMVKSGGGAMHLDLSSADLGRLELAVNLQDDRVDLKILTADDRVREIMTTELSRLRDALSVQNLQLGNVEVGVGQRQSGGFNAFAQHQQSQQGQQELREFHEQLAAGARGAQPALRQSVNGINVGRRLPISQIPMSVNHLNGGRLEVRV